MAGRPNAERAEEFATGADRPRDERPLAVVTPVQVPGPVPVMGLIRRQVERTAEPHEGERRRDGGQDRRRCEKCMAMTPQARSQEAGPNYRVWRGRYGRHPAASVLLNCL